MRAEKSFISLRKNVFVSLRFLDVFEPSRGGHPRRRLASLSRGSLGSDGASGRCRAPFLFWAVFCSCGFQLSLSQHHTPVYARLSDACASHTGFFLSGSITIDPALISGFSSAAKGHHRCHSPKILLITTWRALQVGTLGPIVRYVFSTRSCWGTFPSKFS